ncbi:NADH dehydrogenase [Nitrosospira sp. Nsp11]|uniref:NAD(P)/FAD-dependent oxidoreductase n=1 Tax=Nitrosospira sp. Nsp11 TaxID=1855338 RepID=UPI00091D01F5|nr:FAD-dependent oxidoreductase [Nitrosospira sp. Nsp11]SHL49860.1 NADH dehydrogenase [Nitrosospira sp. Nsp11]
MPFLPFYIPRHKQLKIVIVGGGYAGIAALVTLLRHMPEVRITIIDPRLHHLKITHIHETFRYPLDDFLVSFSDLENRFGCRHVCAQLILNDCVLQQSQKDRFIVVNDEILEFDYLLVASGSPLAQLSKSEDIFDLNDFMINTGSDLLNQQRYIHEPGEKIISVIGGGATGIQFLFEIAHFLQRQKFGWKLRLIHGGDRVLNQFGVGFSEYTQARMSELDIDFYPNTRYRDQVANKILLQEVETGHQFELPSTISLLFLGKKLDTPLFANAFGQVVIEQKQLENIFTAGDCSIYNSAGSNAMTAQSSVRKGMLAARNILRHSGSLKLLEPYFHRDLGYVISLGPSDAVGWLALEGNVVGGMPALMIKEVVEAQYDLLLTGIDTYLI